MVGISEVYCRSEDVIYNHWGNVADKLQGARFYNGVWSQEGHQRRLQRKGRLQPEAPQKDKTFSREGRSHG